MKEELAIAAKHWSAPKPKIGWWFNDQVIRHINKLVCGEPLEGFASGVHKRMLELSPSGFMRGISVGCGNGQKEIDLLKKGIVKRFDLYEISLARAEQGAALAIEQGVADRLKFHVGDAFAANIPKNSYDLVYWNNSLHHMMDVEQAIGWSHERLINGGHFVMDDFVGPARFQWTQPQLDMATWVRKLLPEKYMLAPQGNGALMPTSVGKPAFEQLLKIDPSEAADSDRILEALPHHFKNVQVILTGGCVYFLAMNEIQQNFSSIDPIDCDLLAYLLSLDETLAKMGQSLYAVAFAVKE